MTYTGNTSNYAVFIPRTCYLELARRELHNMKFSHDNELFSLLRECKSLRDRIRSMERDVRRYQELYNKTQDEYFLGERNYHLRHINRRKGDLKLMQRDLAHKREFREKNLPAAIAALDTFDGEYIYTDDPEAFKTIANALRSNSWREVLPRPMKSPFLHLYPKLSESSSKYQREFHHFRDELRMAGT